MATYTNKSFNTATYTRTLGKGDSWTAGQIGVTAGQIDLFAGYWTNPTAYTNKTFIAGDIELLIDGTYSLLIDDTYKLLAEAGIKYTNGSRQSNTYSNKQISNSGRTAQELLIEGAYELLIDDTYSLEIQDAVASQVYTNKVRNN